MIGSRSTLFAICAAACVLTACSDGAKSIATVPSETDANEIIDVLREHGVEADKRASGEAENMQWSVVIAEGWFTSGDTSAAIRVLQDNGLPRPQTRGMERAYEGSGIVSSESAQRAQRLKEHKTEVERQLRDLPGVVRVNVNIVPPDDDAIRLRPHAASASVLVVHKVEHPPFTETEIQRLVAGSVLGLQPERVVVKLAYQQERPTGVDDAPARRRLAGLLATLGSGITVFATIAAVFVLQQNRRRRQERFADATAGDGDAQPAPAQGWLGDGASDAEPRS